MLIDVKALFGCTGQATQCWHPATGELAAHWRPGEGAPARGGETCWPLGAMGNLHPHLCDDYKNSKNATKVKILL
jgi:hypothetical protein